MKDYKKILEGVVNIINTTEKSDIGFANICTYISENCPELKESDDERIRKALLEMVHDTTGDELWVDYNVHKEDAIAWLEKQGTPAKLSEEEQNRFAKGVLTSCAMSFINYLDAHKYEGKMCVSNGECEDIENAFHNAMWDRLHRYYCKYIEKQGEQKPVEWSEEDEEHIESILKRLDGMCKKDATFTKTHFAVNQDMDWLKSLKDSCLPQPKQEWSDADEEELELATGTLLNAGQSSSAQWVEDLSERFKSLRPQKQKEWTKGDIEMIDWLIRCCEKEHEELCNDKYGHQDIVSDLKRDCRKKWNWLESLKNKVVPQNTWKPSEGQLECLGYAIEKAEKDWSPLANNRIYLTLKALKEQLLELRGSKV